MKSTQQDDPGRPRRAAARARAAAVPSASAVDRLDTLHTQVQAIILSRQDARTGLLPASTAITVHGDYTHAWVRDNVYSILAVWALALAYRRIEVSRADMLGERVVALMRGLLHAMMRQSAKVERFKHTQHPLDALHAKYDTATGEPVVGDSEWGHLQIDATAIFVLMLARMSASGLAIVREPSEVALVQNLVWYLAKAWRTPDFGIWERGHKRNEGQAEINGSSVGMAKAALEAIDGFDPLPGTAPAIHVLADDIARARTTLEGLLPRESISKETDAALLSIVGFPAFAVEDTRLRSRTRNIIVRKLQGRDGCKRFLRDGHQTVLEDHARMHYEPGELQRFEHIESEWPLFFAYLLLDALLRGHATDAALYRQRLDELMQERDGQLLLPELYLVPAESVAAERLQPGSQQRVPNENVPLVWAQSLYVVGALLQEGFIDAAALRPARRRGARRPASEAPVQVALLAADELVRARLAAHGLDSETPAQVSPIRLCNTTALERAFGRLGEYRELGLSGRPIERLGGLTTSQVFTCGGERMLVLPALFERRSSYRTLDNRLLVDEMRAELAYIRRHWRRSEHALFVVWITEAMLEAGGSDVLLAFLKQLGGNAGEQGADPGVQLGPLASSLPQAAQARVDWLDALPLDEPPGTDAPRADGMPAWDEAATRPLTAPRALALAQVDSLIELEALLAKSRNPYEQIDILALLWRQHGHAPVAPELRGAVESLHARASRLRLWGVVRRAAGLLELHDESLENAVAQIVMSQRRVGVGRTHAPQAIIATPLGLAEIVARLREHGGDDPRVRVLIEEIVLCLGTLLKAEQELFAGMLTLRAWHLLLLLTADLAREHGVTQAQAFDHLLDISPHAILGRLREVITREQAMTGQLARLQSLPHASGADALVRLSLPIRAEPVGEAGSVPAVAAGGEDWAAWRQMTGVITRVPDNFYERVWDLLKHCRGLVIGDPLDLHNGLDSQLARADMTAAETGFALQVEDMLNKIQAPEYRQLTIEGLTALCDLSQANPALDVDGHLVVDVALANAVELARQQADNVPADSAEAWLRFYARPPHEVAGFVMAAFAELIGQEAQPPLQGGVVVSS